MSAGPLVPLERLVEIMRRLRDPISGCEWDTVQTFETIAPYTIEEAYEVADAIARNDMLALADELGDLQLQVVFHARMAEEAGLFTLEDVLNGICDKMERRHPHIFGDAQHGGHHLWEIIKAEERAANSDKSALAGVALALPALERAAKLQRRAARVGFDWPDVSGPRAKIDEELAELDAEIDHDRKLDELGDLLFAVVNLARHLNVEPEAALREANRKFERRFRAIEQEPGFEAMSLDEKEALWTKAKKAQADSSA
jgi:nucleoside triphosphate diphosphatase